MVSQGHSGRMRPAGCTIKTDTCCIAALLMDQIIDKLLSLIN